MTQTFEEWYEQNKNYYHIKHGGDEKAMVDDARNAYGEIQRFRVAPKTPTGKAKKKKPNPYGFN